MITATLLALLVSMVLATETVQLKDGEADLQEEEDLRKIPFA